MGVINDDDFAVDTAEVEAATAPVENVVATAATDSGTDASADKADEKSDEEKAAEKAAKAAEFEQTLAAFKEAVAGAMASEDRDQTTGTLPEALKQTVTKAYAALPGARGKNAGVAYLQEQMQYEMLAGAEDPAAFVRARSYLEMFNAAKAGAPKEQVVRTPVDPTEAHVALVASLALSPNLVVPGEGVAEDWRDQVKAKVQELTDQVKAYREWLVANAGKATEEQSAAPEVDAIVIAAARLATGRGAGLKAARKVTTEGGSTAPRTPFTGTRRDIGKHIENAFAGVVSGTFLSIQDIVNVKSDEYGDDKPSPGAVAARLFPKSGECTVTGIKPEGPEDGREKKGAVKL